MSKRAILVVDLQNEYWPDGNLPLHGIEAAAHNAARVIRPCPFQGRSVVNIRHEIPRGPIFVPGSAGARINDVVCPPLRTRRSSPRTTPTRSARPGSRICWTNTASATWSSSAP